MAYTDLTDDGAIAFNWIADITPGAHSDAIHMLSGELFAAPKGSGVRPGRWVAYHYRKSESPLTIAGVVDIAPFVIDWITDLDDRQVNGLERTLITLNERSRDIVLWRQQLSQAEHDSLISGAFAALSGASTVASGIALVGDLLAGGIPWASGLWFAGSSVALGSNLGALEAHAKRGDLCVRSINAAMGDVLDLGRQLDLPFCSPHQTPIIQSACTNVAQAFGWKDKQIKATQAGIANWLNADLRFSPS